MTQRMREIRSMAYLDGARGSPCRLRFVGVCIGGTETTVACHIHNQSFGMGQKADDFAIIDGCAACHAFLDVGWAGKISVEDRQFHIIRGLLETQRDRIEREIVKFPHDPTPRPKPTPPRKPKAERQKIPSGRKIQSRNTLKRHK